ncbi:MAG: tyrosine-type recombinase/integrase [Alphaproteobacteria bacterium]|nr:tyrosine-type recombinase/integrase [Alphaproteobacteria bacterium]
MFSNCMAKCMAKTKIKPHLWLRNGFFYCRMELPRVEGKRRYLCYSLYTNDYYEALAKMVEINDFNDKFNKLSQLYSQINVYWRRNQSSVFGGYGFMLNIPDELVLSKNNKPETLIEFMKVFSDINANIEKYRQEKQVVENFEKFKKLADLIEKQGGIPFVAGSNANITPPKHTLKYILEKMLQNANNCEAETKRKTNFFNGVFTKLGLSPDDDYSTFHKTDIIDKISQDIANDVNVKNDNKRQKLRYIKEFVCFACELEPDFYKKNILVSMPKIEKTKKSERQPHLPYSEVQLKEIFNPKHEFFKDNPELFWICLVALFTGARANAATTLQYGDIIVKDGMYCFEFKENHAIKHLKNDASERIVPIHKQLLDLGFVEYFEFKKIKESKKNDDFILSKILTSGGEYNNKYLDRYLFKFFKEIGVKDKGYDFHSFRKNASLALQSAGLIPTIINAIIGWEGKDTMEQSYSNFSLKQIKEEYEKFSYDFLQPEFDKWKKIMAKK